MIYKNCYIFDEKEGFFRGSFEISGDRFGKISSEEASCDAVDLDGACVIPGLVDIHTHGCAGQDFSDGDPDGLKRMAEYYALQGITSFAPTMMTVSKEDILKACRSAALFKAGVNSCCARLMGIHMEGPFLSESKKGAQNAAFLQQPDALQFRGFQDESGGIIKIADVAPELEGALSFIRRVSGECTVSIAHTAADYDTAMNAFNEGASHLTHMFNAMPGIHHREPGPICAAADKEDVTVELICDGIHVHESVIRLAYRIFSGRLCMISDSLRCCGMPDGEYMLGGQKIILKGRQARVAGTDFENAPLAGSASDLYSCLMYAVSIGIDVRDAVNSATIVPAGVIGCAGEIGSIREGKYADFVVCDRNLKRKDVYLGGVRLKRQRC